MLDTVALWTGYAVLFGSASATIGIVGFVLIDRLVTRLFKTFGAYGMLMRFTLYRFAKRAGRRPFMQHMRQTRKFD